MAASILPDTVSLIENGVTLSQQPSLTYGVDFENNRMTGKIDGADAMKQAVFLILSTERFDWKIFSKDYGIELKGLYGMPRSYVEAELPRLIREALRVDDRVFDVTGFSFDWSNGAVLARFTVTSDFGDSTETLEVSV